MALKSTILRRYPGTLAANGIQNFEAYGEFIFLLSNTGTDSTLKVAFDNNEEVALPVGVILKLQQPFSRILVRNTDTGATSFVILCGQGDIDYKALVLSGTITTGPAQSSTATNAADLTAGAAAKIFDSTVVTTVKRIVVANKLSSGGPVYLSFANSVSATRSVYELAPGATVEFTDYKGDLWLFGPLGTEKVSLGYW